MLILTRKPGESLYIGDDIKITIVEIKGHQIRVGIDAPTELRIYREEIYKQILEENRKAAEAAAASSEDLDSLSQAWSSSHPTGTPSGEGETKRKGSIAALRTGGPQAHEEGATDQPVEVVIRKKRGKKTDE